MTSTTTGRRLKFNYRKGIGIELIEDDLLTWLRASSSRTAA